YGLIIMGGAVLAAYLASREAKRRGYDPEIIWDALVWVLIAGIIGARIWHIFTPSPSLQAQGITTQYYLTHPLEAIWTRNSGLGIPGAVIGGALALYLFTRKRGLNFWVWVDIAAPAVALGQAIGRWGNFVNQELYGSPTDLPWAVHIDPQYRLPGFENFETFHPLFLYESIWNLANFFFLIWLGRRYPDKLHAGDLFLIYLVTYPVARFLLEFIRLDSAQIAGLNANQTVMAIVAVLALLALFLRHRRPAPRVAA
ncbi:MAG TPA: prolipoprotein diacylglyceryl transferase, partial [Anaerolineales bacterium]|nr:prolipoprotein diacylglyceryl transferase [Anaerolineales bacterium]